MTEHTFSFLLAFISFLKALLIRCFKQVGIITTSMLTYYEVVMKMKMCRSSFLACWSLRSTFIMNYKKKLSTLNFSRLWTQGATEYFSRLYIHKFLYVINSLKMNISMSLSLNMNFTEIFHTWMHFTQKLKWTAKCLEISFCLCRRSRLRRFL